MRGNVECELRYWDMDDAESIERMLNHPMIRSTLRDLPNPYRLRDAREFLDEVLAGEGDTVFAFAILVPFGRIAGGIAVTRQENVYRLTAELGYYLAPSFWGHGVMTQAIRQICEYVFGHSDIERIYAEPFADNIGSCRALEKAGFQLEGTLRRNVVKDGRFHDSRMYSMLRDEAPSTGCKEPGRKTQVYLVGSGPAPSAE